MAVVQNVILQTGNGQNFLTWNPIASATFTVQRSTDQVNWNTLGTTQTPNYLDAAVSIGTAYYYQVSAGTGYTPSQPNSITPCAPGQINLGYLRYQARLRCDMLKSNFVTNDEWNLMLNSSIAELYGLLVSKYGEDYFLAKPQIFTSNSSLSYPLPNGQNFLNTNGIPDPNGTPAPATYKVYGMDFNSYGAQLNNTQGWVSMSRFNWADHNKFNILLGAASNNVAGQYCSLQFREMGTDVYIIPTNSGQYFRLWYVPIATQLLQDTDMMPFGYSAWWEYCVLDTAAKALAKKQFMDQAQELLNRKEAMMIRIETEAANRNTGQPNTATNSRSTMGDPTFTGPTGSGNGWGGGGWGGGLGYALAPTFLQNNFGYCGLRDTIHFSNSTLALIAGCISLSYFFYLNFTQFGYFMIFPRRASIFGKHIARIFKMGAKK